MSAAGEIEASLSELSRDWDIDPVLRDFATGRIRAVSDTAVLVGGVVFHIPRLDEHGLYVLWRCLWPDCHNCCERQGRLPLTADDLITIGAGLKYSRTSEFIRNETVVASWDDGQGDSTAAAAAAATDAAFPRTVMTAVTLKRRAGDTEADDGTRVLCRFLDGAGACTLHPGRPGVCHLYPFSTWLENEGGRARVHASYQITGDCPGFYLGQDVSEMRQELDEYSAKIYDYNMASARTAREGFGAASIGA